MIDNKLNGIKNFKEMMHTWTKQKGHPVVHLTVNSTHLTLKQNRFILDPVRNNSINVE